MGCRMLPAPFLAPKPHSQLLRKRKIEVSKRPVTKKVKAGLSRAMPSKEVSPPPKSGPAKKIGILKITHPKPKPGLHGMSEIELPLVKPIGVSKKFHGSHSTCDATTRAAWVPAFDNLRDDSLSDIR
jgi:hypothetical protein